MCTTFIVRCMCGHEFHRQVLKCAKAVRSQLDLAETDIVEDPTAARSGCVCMIDLPEEYLKPDICEQCKNKGLISDYLNSDPSVKFDIVREWFAQKRAQKARQIEANVDEDEEATSMQEPEVMTNSSASSATSSGARTPTSSTSLSNICILETNHNPNEAELTALSPILNCIADVNLTRADLDHCKPEAKDTKSAFVSKQTQSFEDTYSLKRRAAALKEKIHFLITENKQRRALEAKD